MAVKRFLLDTSQLNDGNFGLNGFSPPFILDTSQLDGNGLLDGAEFLTVATGAATLGGLVATATTKTAKSAIAVANFSGLIASATTKTSKIATATSDLGGLVAISTRTAPPPEPTPSGGRQYAAPRRKKIEPLPVSVEIPVIQPKRRYAVCSTTLGGIKSQGISRITFSILDDDAEVLLLV